jgi:hypothetical protein
LIYGCREIRIKITTKTQKQSTKKQLQCKPQHKAIINNKTSTSTKTIDDKHNHQKKNNKKSSLLT